MPKVGHREQDGRMLFCNPQNFNMRTTLPYTNNDTHRLRVKEGFSLSLKVSERNSKPEPRSVRFIENRRDMSLNLKNSEDMERRLQIRDRYNPVTLYL